MSARLLATGLAAAALVAMVAPAVSASDHGRTEYMPCASADEAGDPDGPRNCVWDAAHMGNGEGHSFFVGRDGKIYPLPHHIAHALVFGGAR